MRYLVIAKTTTNLIPFVMGSYATGLHIYVGVQSFVGGNVVRSGLDKKYLSWHIRLGVARPSTSMDVAVYEVEDSQPPKNRAPAARIVASDQG